MKGIVSLLYFLVIQIQVLFLFYYIASLYRKPDLL